MSSFNPWLVAICGAGVRELTHDTIHAACPRLGQVVHGIPDLPPPLPAVRVQVVA